MKLWLLTQKVNNRYDVFDSCVVAAKDEGMAKLIHPNSPPGWEGMFAISHWCEPEHVEVKYLGTAKPGTKAGVVLASFNAG